MLLQWYCRSELLMQLCVWILVSQQLLWLRIGLSSHKPTCIAATILRTALSTLCGAVSSSLLVAISCGQMLTGTKQLTSSWRSLYHAVPMIKFMGHAGGL